MDTEQFQQLEDDVATLRSLAKSAVRNARLMLQLAARADDNLRNLQSQGGHKDNE